MKKVKFELTPGDARALVMLVRINQDRARSITSEWPNYPTMHKLDINLGALLHRVRKQIPDKVYNTAPIMKVS